MRRWLSVLILLHFSVSVAVYAIGMIEVGTKDRLTGASAATIAKAESKAERKGFWVTLWTAVSDHGLTDDDPDIPELMFSIGIPFFAPIVEPVKCPVVAIAAQPVVVEPLLRPPQDPSLS